MHQRKEEASSLFYTQQVSSSLGLLPSPFYFEKVVHKGGGKGALKLSFSLSPSTLRRKEGGEEGKKGGRTRKRERRKLDSLSLSLWVGLAALRQPATG